MALNPYASLLGSLYPGTAAPQGVWSSGYGQQLVSAYDKFNPFTKIVRASSFHEELRREINEWLR